MDPTPHKAPHDPIRYSYVFNPANPEDPFDPNQGNTNGDLADFPAVIRLRDGNETFAAFRAECAAAQHDDDAGKGHKFLPTFEVPLSKQDLGLGEEGEFPSQRPFAAVLGCADARVPAEMLFGQTYNALFVVRAAGNTLDVGGAATGSLAYALTHFVEEHKSGVARADDEPKLRMRLAVVLGHRNCGAVKAAVQSYQADPSGATLPTGALSPVLRPIFTPAVLIAAEAFDKVFGGGMAHKSENLTAMTELTVYLNAAWSAHDLKNLIEAQEGGISDKVRTCYGVFDVSDFRVRASPIKGYKYGKSRRASDIIMAEPPASSAELLALGLKIAKNLKETAEGGKGNKPYAVRLPASFFSGQ